MLINTAILSERFLENLNEGMVKRWLSAELPHILSLMWSVVLAFVLYLVGIRIIRFLLKLITKPMELRNVEKGVITFTRDMARIGMYAILIILILQLFGVTTSSIAAAIASVGLAAGLALQGSLSNFAGGVLILVLHPFVVGDYIIEDTHGNEGIVKEITIFYTKLSTPDNKVIVIPNGVLANNSLTNATTSDKRRIDLIISIGYDDDLRKAKQLLAEIVAEEPARLTAEEIQVFVDDLAEHAVTLGLRFWVGTNDYWTARWHTLERIKEVFDANGISIPYNQIDVHMS